MNETQTPPNPANQTDDVNNLVTPEWALHHLCQHEAEHRGQMGELKHRWRIS